MGRHGMRWEELRWDELRWSASVKCGVWGVKSAMWSVRKVFALYRGRAQVMFLDSNTATASHKARTHGPGWRTAHASSLVVVLGSDSWKLRWHMRWDEKRWAGIRWEELRWDEVWSVKSALWSVGREECSVKCGVWRKQWEVRVWSVDCEVWSVECEVWIGKSAVWSEKCGVWSVKCAVWSVKSAVRSVKSEVELQMWHVKQDTTFAECTHARAWLAHGACKFYRWERSYIYIFKATSAPPRAGTTGIEIRLYIWYIYVYIYIYIRQSWAYATWTETDQPNTAWSVDEQKWWLKQHSEMWRREIPAQPARTQKRGCTNYKGYWRYVANRHGCPKKLVAFKNDRWCQVDVKCCCSLILAGARETESGFCY